MSASREKRFRQDTLTHGLSEKEIEKLREQRKEKRRFRLYGFIFAAVGVIALALLIWNTNIIQKNVTAVSIGNERFVSTDLQFYYNSAYNSIYSNLQSQYGDLLPYILNPNIPLSQQQYSEDQTWHDYVMDQAFLMLQETVALSQMAAAEGFTLTEESREAIERFSADVDTICSAYGMTRKSYFASYGETMTEKIFMKHLEATYLAGDYSQHIQDQLTYTTDDYTAYYQEHPEEIDVTDYRYYYFSNSAYAPAEEEHEHTEDEDHAAQDEAAANAAAKAAADAMLAKLVGGTDFTAAVLEQLDEDARADYDETASTTTGVGFSYLSSYVAEELADWLFDTARKTGDNASIEVAGGYYVLQFMDRYRQNYNTVDVRHILVSYEDGEDHEHTDGEEAAHLHRDEALAEAERILSLWQGGAATEASFAELADEYSEDTGSNTTGGLYEQVYKNQMVTNFNDWIFDTARRVGDADIVETDYGFHIIYFAGQNIPYWQLQAESILFSNDYNAWYDALTVNYQISDPGLGARFIKL